jgi:hypothetical protein
VRDYAATGGFSSVQRASKIICHLADGLDCSAIRTFEAIQGTLSIFVAEEAGELVQQCVGLDSQLSAAMFPLGK